jgi:hypothetical protein
MFTYDQQTDRYATEMLPNGLVRVRDRVCDMTALYRAHTDALTGRMYLTHHSGDIHSPAAHSAARQCLDRTLA